MSVLALGISPSLRRSVFSSRTVALSGHVAFRNAVLKVPPSQSRAIQTQSFPASAAHEILNKQRVLRPSSPHFTIYQPQLTWLGSIANRLTGASLSVLLYGFALSYVALPVFGMPFDGAQVVELVHSLPEWVKTSGKVLLAAPFAFHSWNGVRHLLWDMGKFLSVKGAYATGYSVLVLTAATTVGLLFV